MSAMDPPTIDAPTDDTMPCYRGQRRVHTWSTIPHKETGDEVPSEVVGQGLWYEQKCDSEIVNTVTTMCLLYSHERRDLKDDVSTHLYISSSQASKRKTHKFTQRS